MGIIRFKHIALLLLALSSLTAKAQPYTKEYNIALVLPFKTTGYHGSVGEAMLDYYEGFKTAMQQLSNEGFKVRLYTFDSEKDSSSLDNIILHPDMPKMDIVVGPVYDQNVHKIEKTCSDNKSILVSPLKYVQKSLPTTNIINFFAPDSFRLKSTAQKAVQAYPGYRFIIVSNATDQSKKDAAIIKRALADKKVKKVSSVSVNAGKISISAAMKDSIVLISSISTVSSTSIFNNAIKSYKHAAVIGHPEWNSSLKSTFEVDFPRVVYPEVNFIAPDDSAALKFREEFLSVYLGEPSKYAYIGYDQGMYLGYGLMTYGRSFTQNLPNAEYRGFINMIRLENTKNGIVNTGLNYIQIINQQREEFRPWKD